MKIRIKFSKHGNTRYVGHLDMMRYFQKAMRRADIPIRYSEGYSPHQIMSFAAPLGMCVESDAEYMDIETTEPVEADDAIRRLNEAMCEGVRILGWKVMPDDSKTAMSQVEAADYLVLCDDVNLSPIDAPEIIVEKQNKKGEIRKTDIKPLIYSIKKVPDGVFMHIAQGSSNNLKPDTVMNVLGVKKYQVVRKELYGPNGLTL